MFTDIELTHPLVTISIVVLSSMVFATAGFINALFAKNFDDIAIIPTFIIAPLTYLGGVFYSINLLPDFWQNVSLFNPILYMVNAFRYGVLGTSDIEIMYAYAVVCFLKIAEKLSHRPNFINYAFREEMVSDGIENIMVTLVNTFFTGLNTSLPFKIIYF